MSKWRETYNVHPSADVFPMMSEFELSELGEDIKANGLRVPVVIWRDDDASESLLLDGRNRLEAAERAGVDLGRCYERLCLDDDPVVAIIGLNIHRRHLTKQQQADLIVAAIKAAESPRQLGEVIQKRHVEGKRGSDKDPIKTAAAKTAAEHGISKRTVERSLAKAEGRARAAAPRSPTPSGDHETIEAEQRQRLLRVYQQSLPVVQRWFRLKIGAER
jgi:hypothetical protein